MPGISRVVGSEDRRNGAVSERIARLRIELQELEPKIWRRIDMPLSTTLEALHDAIQMTMGWTFSHLWEFDIDGRCYGDPSFREFDDEPPIYKAKGLRPGVLIARGVERFVYTYDFGDNWRHDVIVEEVRDGDPEVEYPAFVDGCPSHLFHTIAETLEFCITTGYPFRHA